MDAADAYLALQRDGYLEVLFFVPHYKDSAAVPQRQCHYWPEIHLVDVHSGLWKQMVPISPTKWKSVVARSQGCNQAYINQINLRKCFLHGPINFEAKGGAYAQLNWVPDTDWMALISECACYGIDTLELNKVVPL